VARSRRCVLQPYSRRQQGEERSAALDAQRPLRFTRGWRSRVRRRGARRERAFGVENGPAALKRWNEGCIAVAQSGCEACHTIGDNDDPGPGPNLTHTGARIPRLGIARNWSTRRRRCRPSRTFPAKKFDAIIEFQSCESGPASGHPIRFRQACCSGFVC
jgi:hypothetical protein